MCAKYSSRANSMTFIHLAPTVYNQWHLYLPVMGTRHIIRCSKRRW